MQDDSSDEEEETKETKSEKKSGVYVPPKLIPMKYGMCHVIFLEVPIFSFI